MDSWDIRQNILMNQGYAPILGNFDPTRGMQAAASMPDTSSTWSSAYPTTTPAPATNYRYAPSTSTGRRNRYAELMSNYQQAQAQPFSFTGYPQSYTGGYDNTAYQPYAKPVNRYADIIAQGIGGGSRYVEPPGGETGGFYSNEGRNAPPAPTQSTNDGTAGEQAAQQALADGSAAAALQAARDAETSASAPTRSGGTSSEGGRSWSGASSQEGGARGTAGGWAQGGHVSMMHLQGPDPMGPDDGYGALKDGEYVINDKAVKKYGIELMQAINSGKISKGKLRGLLEM